MTDRTDTDLQVSKFVEDIFCEDDPASVHFQAKEFPLGRAAGQELRRDARRFADKEIDNKAQVRDRLEGFNGHIAKPGKPERTTVVLDGGIDEPMKLRPILPIQARDIPLVDINQRNVVQSENPSKSDRFGSPSRGYDMTGVECRSSKRRRTSFVRK